MYGKELSDLREFSIQKRKESRDIVNEMAKRYQRQGMFLNEIIEQEKSIAYGHNLEVDEYDDKE